MILHEAFKIPDPFIQMFVKCKTISMSFRNKALVSLQSGFSNPDHGSSLSMCVALVVFSAAHEISPTVHKKERFLYFSRPTALRCAWLRRGCGLFGSSFGVLGMGRTSVLHPSAFQLQTTVDVVQRDISGIRSHRRAVAAEEVQLVLPGEVEKD